MQTATITDIDTIHTTEGTEIATWQAAKRIEMEPNAKSIGAK